MPSGGCCFCVGDGDWSRFVDSLFLELSAGELGRLLVLSRDGETGTDDEVVGTGVALRLDLPLCSDGEVTSLPSAGSDSAASKLLMLLLLLMI